MPQIQMPEKEPEPEPVQEQVTERNEPNDKQLIQNIQDEMMDDLPSDNDEIIEVTERNIPSEDDVFSEPTPRVKPIVEEEPEEPQEFTQKKGKRKYTRKAPMSDKQKAHLEKIRKISLEKRAQKKLEREEEKKRKEEEKEEARILKAQERLLQKQKKEQDRINNENNVKKPEPRPQALFTQQDMEKAMYSAIASYETVRKKQKEEKKQQELANAREAQMRRTLEQAIRPAPPPDPWRQFFS